MSIIHSYHKKCKARKPTKADKELAEQWERLVRSHQKPLEQGVKVRGRLPGPSMKALVKPQYTGQAQRPRPEDPPAPSLPMGHGGTKPAIDPIASEKRALKARVGQEFNKAGLTYLTDDVLAEQKTGNHRRR